MSLDAISCTELYNIGPQPSLYKANISPTPHKHYFSKKNHYLVYGKYDKRKYANSFKFNTNCIN